MKNQEIQPISKKRSVILAFLFLIMLIFVDVLFNYFDTGKIFMNDHPGFYITSVITAIAGAYSQYYFLNKMIEKKHS